MDERDDQQAEEADELQPWVVVEFTYEPPDGASSVALAGDFNDWSPDVEPMERNGQGGFHVMRSLPADRRFCYRFVVDGQRWETDPNAEAFDDDGYGGQNAVVHTPGTAS
jgi:1,4-alpha-glucan branching enzyme